MEKKTNKLKTKNSFIFIRLGKLKNRRSAEFLIFPAHLVAVKCKVFTATSTS